MAATTPTAIPTTKVTVASAAGTLTRHPGHVLMWTASADPTADNDGTQGVNVGDIWVSTTGPKVLVCTSNGTGAAVWTQVS